MSRRVRFQAFDNLSSEGQAAVLHGLNEDWPQRKIQAHLEAETGETISNGSLGRFVQWWREQRKQERQAQQFAQQTIDAMKAGKIDAQDMGESMIMQAMLQNMDNAKDLDAEKSMRLNMQYIKSRQRQRAIELAERQKDAELELQRERLKLAEQQLDVQRQRLKERARDVVREVEDAQQKVKSGGKLTVAELNRIRTSVYGLGEVDGA